MKGNQGHQSQERQSGIQTLHDSLNMIIITVTEANTVELNNKQALK